MVAIIPFLIKQNNIAILPLLILGLLVANGLSSLLVKDNVGSFGSSSEIKIIKIIKNPMVIAFLLTCALQAMSHGAYYTFFSIYLEDHGYSRTMTGMMWALGVLAEVFLFMIVHRYFVRIGTCRLFVFSLFITSIRWVILALWVDSLALLLFAQLLHAASFGLFHATAINLTHQLFPGRLQGRGQALYAGLSFGLGGSLGNWLSGYSWEVMGSSWTFLASAVIALIGAIIAANYVTEKQLPAYACKP
jgi:PPP family 3-phenylpropionic acid transporter